jgi:DNA invertase Pin-like site-specific DNA recombinase
MRVKYIRCSSASQNPERQDQDKNFDYIFTDFCSGSIPLFQRPKGLQIKRLLDDNKLTELHIHSIDRLGRSTLDVLSVWEELTSMGIIIVCANPSIRNITTDGKVDKFSELLMSILSMMSQFEKNLIKERQMEGIRLRQAKGLYTGRKVESRTSPEQHIKKDRSQKILKYLSDGNYTFYEISKILKVSPVTIRKTKNIAKELGVLV